MFICKNVCYVGLMTRSDSLSWNDIDGRGYLPTWKKVRTIKVVYSFVHSMVLVNAVILVCLIFFFKTIGENEITCEGHKQICQSFKRLTMIF